MEFRYRFHAGFGHQEAIIVYVRHKEVLGEDAGREGVAEDEEAGFKVGVAVGEIHLHFSGWQLHGIGFPCDVGVNVGHLPQVLPPSVLRLMLRPSSCGKRLYPFTARYDANARMSPSSSTTASAVE